MKLRAIAFSLLGFTVVPSLSAIAGFQDTVGATLLFATTTNLNGVGIRVGQAEAEGTLNSNDWEVNPTFVGHTNGFITYYTNTSSSTFPNSLGTETYHGDVVGTNFYGYPGGMATNVSHVDEYEANYFVNNMVSSVIPPTVNGDRIINQSFTFGTQTASTQMQYDQYYDNFEASNKVLMVSAAGDGGSIALPATSYNCLAVAAYLGATSYGPTIDNGRAKPEIASPADATSYSTPQVAGGAALLMQAANRGDGGADTNSAGDMRTVKALLLNGAIKQPGWHAPSPSPLDTNFGAGVMNVFNSYHQLIGGKNSATTNGTYAINAAHPQLSTTSSAAETNLNAWDFATNTSSVIANGLQEYHLVLPSVTNGISNATYTAVVTLVWNRQQNRSTINNLYLYLYNLTNSALIAQSVSTVDNLQHLYVTNIPAGHYALQVVKAGGTGLTTLSETYALAYAFYNQTLTVKKTNGEVTLKWPLYPQGYLLQSTAALNPSSWNTYGTAPTILSNNYYTLSISPGSDTAAFFRLKYPNL